MKSRLRNNFTNAIIGVITGVAVVAVTIFGIRKPKNGYITEEARFNLSPSAINANILSPDSKEFAQAYDLSRESTVYVIQQYAQDQVYGLFRQYFQAVAEKEGLQDYITKDKLIAQLQDAFVATKEAGEAVYWPENLLRKTKLYNRLSPSLTATEKDFFHENFDEGLLKIENNIQKIAGKKVDRKIAFSFVNPESVELLRNEKLYRSPTNSDIPKIESNNDWGTKILNEKNIPLEINL